MISREFEPMVTELAMRAGFPTSNETIEDLAVAVLRRRGAAEEVLSPGRPDPTGMPAARRRYIIAPPQIQTMAGPSVRQSLERIDHALAPMILRRGDKGTMKVLLMSPLEAALMRESFSDLLVEEDQPHRPFRSPLLPELDHAFVPAAVAPAAITVEVVAGEQPISDARILLLTDASRKRGYEGRTGPDGRTTIALAEGVASFDKVIVSPRSGFWSVVHHNVAAQPVLRFAVKPLRVDGFDWGHLATEADRRGTHAGTSVKVCIIDSGAATHPSLNIAGGRNFVDGESEDGWRNDVTGHGTHCAGIVAALTRAASVWGYVPQAELYIARIFGGPNGQGYTSDIVDAIDWAISQGCNIVSMSFGRDTASPQMRKKIEAAWDAGVLCVAAAGNEAGPVAYPARFPNVIGVSAIGQLNTYPSDSIHVDAESTIRSVDGQFYLASFSNHGEGIDFCAPGVAVTSTLPGSPPEGCFGAWDGTSMACPHLAGIAALTLSVADDIRQVPPEERGSLLVDKLTAIARDIGMGIRYQGKGLPSITKLFK